MGIKRTGPLALRTRALKISSLFFGCDFLSIKALSFKRKENPIVVVSGCSKWCKSVDIILCCTPSFEFIFVVYFFGCFVSTMSVTQIGIGDLRETSPRQFSEGYASQAPTFNQCTGSLRRHGRRALFLFIFLRQVRSRSRRREVFRKSLESTVIGNTHW